MKYLLLGFAASSTLILGQPEESPNDTMIDVVFLQQGEEITEVIRNPIKKPFIIENPNDPESMFILSSTATGLGDYETEVTLRNNVSNNSESISVEVQKEYSNCIDLNSTFGENELADQDSLDMTELCIEISA